MTQEQMEHTLRVMFEEIKTLKLEVKKLNSAIDLFSTLDLHEDRTKRNYWNVDNRPNR